MSEPRHILDPEPRNTHRTTPGAGTQIVLGDYDGQPIVGSTVSIRNTGDGLSEAMKVDPVKLPRGQEVYVVLECEVEKHRYDPEDKDLPGGPTVLVNMLKAGRATLVDAELVAKHLDEQQERIDERRAGEEQRAREEAGEAPLPFDDDGGDDAAGGEERGSELEETLAVTEAVEDEQ